MGAGQRESREHKAVGAQSASCRYGATMLMWFKSLVAFCMIMLLLVACAASPPPLPTPTVVVNLEVEEYKVYAEALAELHGVIRERTAELDWVAKGSDFGRQLDYVSTSLTLTTDIKEDFIAKNRLPITLGKKLDLQTYSFITDAQQQAVFGSDLQKGWERFHEQYGNQLITLSRPGFNGQMNRALIYADYERGPLDGAGFYMLMAKANGRWTVQKKLQVWIA